MASPITTEAPTVQWPGASGSRYTYWVYPIDTPFTPAPGNYVFAKLVNGFWSPVYIGETADLSERFQYHHARPCINLNGATHIHAHRNFGGQQARLNEETDLRHNYTTSCNRQ